jgi:TRAP-type C4-dicarboxylate transport system permease small subunit
MQILRQWTHRFCTWGEWVGIVGIMVMLVVTCADVLGAKLFLLPVPGATEIVSLVQIATVIFAVAITQKHGGHISVEMFVDTLPRRWKAVVRAFTSLLCLILFIVLIYQGFILGNDYLESGEVTATIELPFYPFAYGFSIALIPMALLMLIYFIEAIKEAVS